jgi:hypothetical protein
MWNFRSLIGIGQEVKVGRDVFHEVNDPTPILFGGFWEWSARSSFLNFDT